MRRVVLAVLVVLAGLLCAVPVYAAPPAGQTPDGPSGRITDVKTQTGLVQFNLVGLNLPDGAQLDPSSIVVTVGSEQLNAKAGAAARQSVANAQVREVVLALDTSGSMQGDGIAAARSAAAQYVRSLPSDVRVGLVSFASTVHVLLRPTADRSKVTAAINGLRAGGETTLYDGVLAAASITDASSQRRLLILSDGDDTSSRHSLADVESTLAGKHLPGDVVAFRLPGEPTVLKSIASASGGRVLPASSAGSLAGAFASAANAFRQQVLVSVTVPRSLANQTRRLDVSATAGSSSISASVVVKLPFVAGAATSTHLVTSEPAGSTSNVGLIVIIVVSFLGLLLIALVALFAPLMRKARADKASRLADVHRYRVVGALGTASPQPAVAERPTASSALTERTLSFVDKAVRAGGKREGLVSELDRAGLRIRPEEWAALQVLVPVILGALLAFVASSFVAGIIGAIIGLLAVRAYIARKIANRAAAFSEQLPETLQLLIGSLRTGFSLNQAFAGVVREGNEPTASEFARALTEVRIGADLEDAIDGVADRMQSEDLHLVVTAVRISREVGGNLSEVLATTMTTMRQRVELRGLIKILSAEGRLSARILIGLPFAIAAFLSVFRPNYLKPLFHSGIGIGLLIAAGVLLALGALWLNRITKIEV
jgi:tight adherence protein B